MTTELCIAYGAYLVWLTCGLCDFITHRLTDLPHTSGLPESISHIAQLSLLGAAAVLVLACELSSAVAAILLLLVLSHALVGYLDTRIAFAAERTITPFEQHLHSVLDMAPGIAMGWLVASARPVILKSGWEVIPRDPPSPFIAWCAVILPAMLLCVVPAATELMAARRAQRGA